MVRWTVDSLNLSFINFKPKSKTSRELNEFKINVKKQIDLEHKYIDEYRLCHFGANKTIDFLRGLSPEHLNKELHDNFYDINIQEGFRCILNTILDNKDGNNNDTVQRIHEFIENPTKFGASSENGYAMMTGFKNQIKKINNIVIKAPIDPDDSPTLTHEVCVGLLALNKLRAKCPNFSYIYDGFECSQPTFLGGNKLSSGWCIPGNNIRYAAYELVNEPITFEDIKDQEEIVQWYLSICLALRIANRDSGFVHMDSHGGNILGYNYSDDEIYIPYEFLEKIIYIRLKKGRVPMFIDYGMSRYVVNNGKGDIKAYGVVDPTGYFDSFGVNASYNHVIGDCYKLICFILIKNRNQGPANKVCRQIMGYFFGVPEITFEQSIYILNNQVKQLFFLSAEMIDPQWTIDGLILRILNIAVGINPKNIINDNQLSRLTNPKILIPKSLDNNKIINIFPKISTMANNVPTVYDIYISNKDDRIRFIEIMSNNLDQCLNEESRRLSPLLFYTPTNLGGDKRTVISELGYAIEIMYLINNEIIYLKDVEKELSEYSLLKEKLEVKKTNLISHFKSYITSDIPGMDVFIKLMA